MTEDEQEDEQEDNMTEDERRLAERVVEFQRDLKNPARPWEAVTGTGGRAGARLSSQAVLRSGRRPQTPP